MASFKDKKGRTWLVEVDGELVERLAQSELKLDIWDAGDPEKSPAFYRRLSGRTLVDVLWFLVMDKAAAASVDVMSFAAGLGGDAIERAETALHEAIEDFFPQRLRGRLTAARAAVLKVERMAIEKQAAAMTDPRLEERIAAAFDGCQERALQLLDDAARLPTAAKPFSDSAA
jgi:hypothetical protein